MARPFECASGDGIFGRGAGRGLVIRHGVAGMFILRRALFGRKVPHGAVINSGRRLLCAVRAVLRVILRDEGRSAERRAGKKQRPHQDAALSGNGRTVTTCIIPACM
jgi:hypothetical protein